MKYSAILSSGIVLLGLLLLCWSGCYRSPDKLDVTVPRFCPYGHEDMKAIPIRRGVKTTWLTKWQQEHHQFVIDNSCSIHPADPKFSVECITCGFMYYESEWNRSSKDPDSFTPKISDRLQSFVRSALTLKHYDQNIDKAGRLSESCFLIIGQQQRSENEKNMDTWIKEHGGGILKEDIPLGNEGKARTWRAPDGTWEISFTEAFSGESYLSLKCPLKPLQK